MTVQTRTEAPEHHVLLLGATGRTGGRVLHELLAREVPTRVIVRSAGRLPEGLSTDPRLTVLEADLLDLAEEDFAAQVDACGAVISCLGHTLDLRGIFGPPRDLVERAVANVLAAAGASERREPLRVILMSSVSVNPVGRREERRTRLERIVLAILRTIVPPAGDNQRAADLIAAASRDAGSNAVGVVVRPDTLAEGAATPYEVHETLVASLFRARTTRMANVARFLADLALDDDVWARRRGTMPVIVDAETGPMGGGGAVTAR